MQEYFSTPVHRLWYVKSAHFLFDIIHFYIGDWFPIILSCAVIMLYDVIRTDTDYNDYNLEGLDFSEPNVPVNISTQQLFELQKKL